MAQPSDTAERILLVLAAGIGDLVMAAAALKALRFSRPQAHITLLVSPKCLSYARLCPYVDEAIAIPTQFSSVWSAVKTAAVLRRGHFDFAINLYGIGSLGGAAKMRALFAIINPKVSAGRNCGGYDYFFDRKVEERDGDGKCQSDYYAELLLLIGVRTFAREKAAIWFAQDSEARAEEFLAANGIAKGDRIIGINPASARRNRQWNAARFAQVAAGLYEQTGCKFVVLGGPGDRRLADELVRAMARKPAVAAGALSYDESAALIKRLHMLLTVHSSVLHTANALNVPCVCLIGPGNAEKDGPYSPEPKRMRLILPKTPCAPCERGRCRSSKCMSGIQAREVLDAALNLWENVYG